MIKLTEYLLHKELLPLVEKDVAKGDNKNTIRVFSEEIYNYIRSKFPDRNIILLNKRNILPVDESLCIILDDNLEFYLTTKDVENIGMPYLEYLNSLGTVYLYSNVQCTLDESKMTTLDSLDDLNSKLDRDYDYVADYIGIKDISSKFRDLNDYKNTYSHMNKSTILIITSIITSSISNLVKELLWNEHEVNIIKLH